jgi:hypothetical protein
MRYRKLTTTGDYSFGNGQLDFFINTPEAVAQAVETTLRLFLGEWYLNLNDGTPYFQGILGKHSKDMADATILATISNVPGVVSVDNYSSVIDPVTRNYTNVSGTLNTVYGVTQLQLSQQGEL